jgi:hypothetical protein
MTLLAIAVKLVLLYYKRAPPLLPTIRVRTGRPGRVAYTPAFISEGAGLDPQPYVLECLWANAVLVPLSLVGVAGRG